MVPTHLKHIRQNGNLPQIRVKIRHIWNHHPVYNSPLIRPVISCGGLALGEPPLDSHDIKTERVETRVVFCSCWSKITFIAYHRELLNKKSWRSFYQKNKNKNISKYYYQKSDNQTIRRASLPFSINKPSTPKKTQKDNWLPTRLSPFFSIKTNLHPEN